MSTDPGNLGIPSAICFDLDLTLHRGSMSYITPWWGACSSHAAFMPGEVQLRNEEIYLVYISHLLPPVFPSLPSHFIFAVSYHSHMKPLLINQKIFKWKTI